MTRRIIVVGADKGGVGKTTTARALLDWEPMRGARVLDADGNLSKFHANAVRVDLASVPDQMLLFDVASDLTVVDCGAGQLSSLLRLMREAGYLADAGQGTLSLTILHVIGPNTMSLDEIPAVNAQLAEGGRHVLVKCRTMEKSTFFEFQPDIAAALSFADARNVATIPHLDEYVQENVDLARLGYAAFCDAPRQSDLQRRKVRHWLGLCCAEFARAEIGR